VPLTLKELEGEFLKITGPREHTRIQDIKEAQGIFFLCPKCFVTNGNSNVGTHGILIWFNNKNVPPEYTPTPRWDFTGTSLQDLTITPSILIKASCAWHGFIRNGEAVE